jgi:hypothetical protein
MSKPETAQKAMAWDRASTTSPRIRANATLLVGLLLVAVSPLVSAKKHVADVATQLSPMSRLMALAGTRLVRYAGGHSSTTKVALSTRTDPSGPTTKVAISWIRIGPSKLLYAVARTTVPPGVALKETASVKREPQVSCGSSRNVNV